MPMKLFVSCAGDLATVGGPVVVVTLLRSLIFLFARPWELENFSTMAFRLRSGRADLDFLRGGDGSRTA